MKCTVNNQVVLSRAPEGPLVAQIGSFAESVSEQGYSLASIHRQVLLAACFSRWLQQNGVGLRSICSDHPVRYLRYRARRVRPGRGDAAALRHLIGFLRWEGVIPDEKKLACQSTPVEHCAQAFGRYLLEVRALARPTIINYVPFIRSFLQDRFGSAQVTLSRLCAPSCSTRNISGKLRLIWPPPFPSSPTGR
jgi:integrase/recombinase XerD